jgi:hypothetical protein
LELRIKNKIKIIFIAPFWNRNDHVGRYRVERSVRWLVSENYHVTIIWSGGEDKFVKREKWNELEIRDPLRRFTKAVIVKSATQREIIKNNNNFREFVKKIVFYFDDNLIWSFLLTKKNAVKNVCKDATIIISSSPPESIHLSSYLLAKKFNLKLVIDLRDGWIDEPIRPYGKRWSFKWIIEKRWESKILKQAAQIFVTSNIWAKLLEKRIPIVTDKISILTNAYPLDIKTPECKQNPGTSLKISLLHAGRFTGTRSTNKMSLLIQPLYEILKVKGDIDSEIILLGNLKLDDLDELKYWKSQFSNTSSKIIIKDRIKRNEMFTELIKADGLLLLASTKAFFPSKAFEYIKSTKPILAITLKGSTIWEVGNDLPQMFLFDYTAKVLDYSPIEKFFYACRTGNYDFKIPEKFSEEYLSKIFLDKINQMLLIDN